MSEHQLGAIAMTQAATLRRLVDVIEAADRQGTHHDQGVAESLTIIKIAFGGDDTETMAEMVRIRAATVDLIIEALEAGIDRHIVGAAGHLARAAEETFQPGRIGPQQRTENP